MADIKSVYKNPFSRIWKYHLPNSIIFAFKFTLFVSFNNNNNNNNNNKKRESVRKKWSDYYIYFLKIYKSIINPL